MPSPRTSRATAALVPLLLLLAACGSGGDAAGPPAGRTSRSPAVPPAPTATPTPTPTVTADTGRPTAAPTQRVDSGPVANGTSAQATGSGSAEITYTRTGEIAVVIVLDCSACAAGAVPTVLTGPGRMTPYDEGTGPLAGSYLMDVFEGSAPEQSVWLQADGPWSIRFQSWNDLPAATGPQSGTGSTVVRVSDQGTRAEVSWAPAGPGDVFSGRFFGAGDQQLFGDDEAFTEVMDLPMPGILAIRTRGSWTVTPQT